MSNEIKAAETSVAASERNVTDMVLGRVSDMMSRRELFMPADYSPENALKSAWLTLQDVEDRDHNKALQVCSKQSICNSLLDMVVQGLSPAKKQCYFVVYGKELTLMRSYMGTVAVAKRFSDVSDVYANVIYEGDTFEFEIIPETGLKKITKHNTSFENIDINKIKGAYAVVVREDADNYVEIMTMDQIKKAWNQGAKKGSSPAHKNFSEEMAKKTVINRACKMFVNTSNDSAILTDAFNRTTDADYQRNRRDMYDSAEVIVDVADEELRTAASNVIFGDSDQAEADTSGDGIKTPFDDPEEMEKEVADIDADAGQGLEAGDQGESNKR